MKLILNDNGTKTTVLEIIGISSMSIDQMLNYMDWEQWQLDHGFDPHDDNYSLLELEV